MPTRKRRGRPRQTLSFHLAMGTQIELDYLVELFQAYHPQVEGLRFKKVTRSILVRMAIAHLYQSVQLGLVGPELLHRTGRDGRAGRQIGVPTPQQTARPGPVDP